MSEGKVIADGRSAVAGKGHALRLQTPRARRQGTDAGLAVAARGIRTQLWRSHVGAVAIVLIYVFMTRDQGMRPDAALLSEFAAYIILLQDKTLANRLDDELKQMEIDCYCRNNQNSIKLISCYE